MEQLSIYFAIFILLQGALATFIDHPSTSNALTNQPFTLSCQAHDEPPLPHTIIWFKDGVAKSSDERIGISYNSSVLRSEYIIYDVLYADDGKYKCAAYNSSVNTTNPGSKGLLFESNEGTLTATGVPAFDPPLQPQTLAVGSDAVFQCNVVSNPSATTQWSFNNEELSHGGQYVINGEQLTVLSVQTSNGGYYKCAATNSFGKNATTAKLSVMSESVPVVEILEPDVHTVAAGDSVVLHCTVEGDDIATIEWKRGPNNIPDGISLSADGADLHLEPVSVTDNDTVFTCQVNTSTGISVSDSITVIVIVAPVVVITPAELTKSEFEFVSESEMPRCTSSSEGGEADHYVWRRDGVQEGSDSTLSLNIQADRNEAGVYECYAFNDAGSSTAEFTYIINYLEIADSNQLLFITVTFGQDVMLPCVASGYPEPTVSWFFSGIIQEHAVYTKEGLILHSVSLSDSGQYICIAQNGVSVQQQRSYTLTVANPPSIVTIDPNDHLYLKTGESFTVTCSILNTDSSTINWYHNDKVITDLEDGRIIIEENDPIYSITVTNAATSDSGVYGCNVTNNFIFDYFASDITVGTSPVIVKAPQDINTTQEESILLECELSGIPEPLVKWSRTGEFGEVFSLELTGESYRVETKGLRLLNTQREDSGMYRCQGNNSIGTVEAVATVRVEGEPKVVNITPTILIADDTYNLTCSLTYNYPAAIIQWFKGSTDTPLTSNRFVTLADGTLIISPVRDFDEGPFICRATNQYGANDYSVLVEVRVRPIVSLLEEMTVTLDSNFSIQCSSIGKPEPFFQMKLPSGAFAGSNLFDSATGVLTIDSASSAHRGIFTCIANNIVGSDSGEITVHVQGAPLTNVLPTSLSSTAVEVTWEDPVNSKPLLYILKYGISDLSNRSYANGTDLSAMVTNLEEFTEYEFEVRGIYIDGIVGVAVTVSVVTLESAPSGSPNNITLTPQEEAIDIYWKPLDRFEQNSRILGYNIYYRESVPIVIPANATNATNRTTHITANQTSFSKYEFVVQNQTATEFYYFLTGLKGGVEYDIILQAYSAPGVGPESDLFKETTKEVFPLVLVLSITIPIGVILLVALGVALVVLAYFCIKRIRKSRLYSPRKGEKGYDKKRRKKKRARPEVSGPALDIPPDIDSSSKSGKFRLHRSDGTTIPSHPKIIQPSDAAPKRKTGATIIPKDKHKSYSDNYEVIDESPEPVARKAKKTKGKDPKRGGFAPRDSSDSTGIYEKPRGKQPRLSTESYDDDDDLPLEMPLSITPRHGRHDGGRRNDYEIDEDSEEEPLPVKFVPRHGQGGRDSLAVVEEEEEYSDDDQDDDDDDDDESDLYAQITAAHKAKKREKMLKQLQKEEEKKKKEEAKRQSKLLKEREKQKKKQEKERKKSLSQQQRKLSKEEQRRQSLGLDNIMSMHDMGSGGSYGAGGNAAAMF